MRAAAALAPAAAILVAASVASPPRLQEAAARAAPHAAGQDGLRLAPCQHRRSGAELLCGTYRVFEDRASRSGRVLGLNVLVLPARRDPPAPDPIFWLAGGPGQAATSLAPGLLDSWLREERDIVLVDQRGTGGSNPLRCDLPGDDQDLQGYLAPLFSEETFRDCLRSLQDAADLRFYTTPIAMDDLDEVRAALGYERINLVGGSYGTRAALVYLRRHPESVRSVLLNGVAPIAFTNPLFHARGAQDALDLLFAECAADPACHAAFPELAQELQAVLARLEAQSAVTSVQRAGSGEKVEVVLSRYAFAEALRVLLYYLPTSRDVPFLIHQAYLGNYRPFAAAGLRSNRSLREALSFGMLMCVTCSEDIPRIDPGTIEAATRDTFLGDHRVRSQIAACALWPRGQVPDGYGEPVRSDKPVLLLSGTLDPVTPPRWGTEAARHLSNSLHLVVPGAHGVGGPCLESIQRQFLAEASVAGLDTSCVEGMELPPFRLRE